MKRIVVLMLLVLLASPALSAQTLREVDAAVWKAMTDYDAAWNKKDVAAVSNILTDDYVYFSSTGGLTDRKATLEFLARPDYKLTFVERAEITVISKTPNVAVVSSRWKGKGTFGKETIDDDQRCGLVFVNAGKRWKLISEHCTQIVSK